MRHPEGFRRGRLTNRQDRDIVISRPSRFVFRHTTAAVHILRLDLGLGSKAGESVIN